MSVLERVRANDTVVRVRSHFASEKRREAASGLLYIAPFFILFLIFEVFPIFFSFYLSMQKWNGLGEIKYVGFQNFSFIFQDPVFWKSLSNTFIMGLMGTAPQLIVAILLAVALNSALIRFKNFFRIAFFMPYVTSVVAVAVIFSVMFSEQPSGLVNATLGLFGIEPVNWKTSEWGVKIAISVMVFWRWVGYNTIIYLAGLQSIPGDLYEAAKIDGANFRQQFQYITIPLLKPVILFTVIISTIGALQLFVEPLIFLGRNMREEGITVVLYLYRNAFVNNAFGTASATAVVLFLLIVAFSALNSFIANRIGKSEKGE